MAESAKTAQAQSNPQGKPANPSIYRQGYLTVSPSDDGVSRVATLIVLPKKFCPIRFSNLARYSQSRGGVLRFPSDHNHAYNRAYGTGYAIP